MKTILILEDDVIFSRSIGNWLKKKGMATEHAATLSAARKALSAREFDLVLADLRLPDGNSTSLLEWMNERFYATPFLIMTNYGQVENAVEAMQLGAVNYLCKPVQPDRLLEAIGKIFSRPRHDGNEFYRGESAKAREMYRLVGLVARSDISVLIRGASGTGKEHIARELHEQSHRKPVRGFNSLAAASLQKYPWPGNIRELRNCIQRAVLLSADGWISPEELNLDLAVGREETAPIPEEKEKQLLLRTLEEAEGNRARAARILGISRTSLYEKLRKYRII